MDQATCCQGYTSVCVCFVFPDKIRNSNKSMEDYIEGALKSKQKNGSKLIAWESDIPRKGHPMSMSLWYQLWPIFYTVLYLVNFGLKQHTLPSVVSNVKHSLSWNEQQQGSFSLID